MHDWQKQRANNIAYTKSVLQYPLLQHENHRNEERAGLTDRVYKFLTQY